MKYLLTLTYRDGEGPEEGTPEFDAEMKVWDALNEELKDAGLLVAASGLKPETATTVARRARSPTGRTRRPRRSCSPSTSSTSRTSTRRSRWAQKMPATEYGSVTIHATTGFELA